VVILALDTTTRAGSCALWQDGRLSVREGRPDVTHAQRLPGDLADLAAAHDVALRDVDRYAVASGPGSFTGLRVGIATIQALALVHDRLVVPVPTLDALAQAGARASAQTLIASWMEAYRGEVFAALYRVHRPDTRAGDAGAAADATGLVTLTPIAPAAVGAPGVMAAEFRRLAGGEAVAFVGDAVDATRDDLVRVFGDGVERHGPGPLAGVIAEMAAADPARAVRPHAIVPEYVRRPDAELARDRRTAEAASAPRAPSNVS